MNKDYCIQYFKRYPNSEIQDFIKFIYQSIMGSGHLICDVSKNYEMFIKEYNSIEYDKKHIVFEDISDQLVRIHMESLSEESLKEIHNYLMLSRAISGNKEELIEALRKVEAGIREGWIPFEMKEWKKEIDQYIADGCPIISHSDTFRKLYHPHYRLLKKEYKKRISQILS